MKQYLGINIGSHDSSTCVVSITEKIDVTVYEEERFSRKKHRGFFPYTAVSRMLAEFNLESFPARNVGATSFMETFQESVSRDERSHVFNDFVEAKKCEILTNRNTELTVVTHHEAHLFAVLPQIRSHDALIVVADSCGSPMKWARENALFPFPVSSPDEGHENVTAYVKRGAQVECVVKIPTRHLIDGTCDAKLASEVYCKTADFIFGSWKHCGKLMGLAAFSTEAPLTIEELLRILDEETYAPVRTRDDFDRLTPTQFTRFARLAASAQLFFEDWFFAFYKNLNEMFPDIDVVHMTGGSALNCLFNTKLQAAGLFREVNCIAFPNDEGVAIGSALAAAYKKGDYAIGKQEMAPTAFLGSRLSLGGSVADLQVAGFSSRDIGNELRLVAQDLNSGAVVAWAMGRSECGPRALGHRSLLASPMEKGIKNRLNHAFKFRELFRPYGISILEEDAANYFEVASGFRSPYMSFAPVVRSEFRDLLSEVVQPDGSLRVQTVGRDNRKLFMLLSDFKELSGHGILIHTSLNRMGEPIVETLNDVVRLLAEGPVTLAVINDQYFRRETKA